MIKHLFTIPLDDPLLWIWLLCGSLLLISFIVQYIYFFRFYNALSSYVKLNEKTDNDPVSVIICAKNEADNLRRFLPSVLNQIYPQFEVIVVDDGSADDTMELLTEFKSLYPHLYVTGIEGKRGNVSGKKVAQTIGIKAAHHDQLIFTNADCEPLSPNWLRHIQSNFLQKTEIVLGYGGYKSRKGFLNKWIRTDTIYLALKHLSFAIKGIPYMGVGRNLAYRRRLFFENKGFASHLHIPSGDDELFVNETSTRYNTAVEIHPDSHTMSEPEESWRKWFRKKRQNFTTGNNFRKKHKKLIAYEIISRELFFVCAIFLISFWKLPGFVFVLFLLREITFAVIFKRTMNRLKEKNLLLISLIYDIIWPLISVFLVFRNKIGPKNPKWK